MCVCVCVCNQYAALHFCICSIYIYIYLYTCAQIRVWSCLVADNFDLFTEIAVCKFFRGLVVVWPEIFLFCPLYVNKF